MAIVTICSDFGTQPNQGGVICISEVNDSSPGNLASSLCFIQLNISYDVLSIYIK